MSDRIGAGIREFLRLTRAGQLGKAAALAHGLLRGAPEALPPYTDRHDDSVTDLATGQVAPDDPSPREDAAGGLSHELGMLHDIVERLRPLADVFGVNIGLRSPAPEEDVLWQKGSFLDLSFTNHAGSRAYKLYIPSGYCGQPIPLVVMLHGCTQNPDDFARGTRMNALAEENSCLVAYPSQPRSANASKCWNWYKPGDQARGQGEPSLIAGMTRQIMENYAVDPQRVYVAGLSAGGATAAIMGATYPELYAAIGIHSGLACGAAHSLGTALAAMRKGPAGEFAPSQDKTERRRPVPTIVFHGDLDKTVNPRNSEAILMQARAGANDGLRRIEERGRVGNGHDYSRVIEADRAGRPLLERWIVHGSGHAWSGGSPAGSFTDPKGPDAAREMLRFFFEQPGQLEHPRPAQGRSARSGEAETTK